ncbi:hypothetical protein CHS0354_012071 [Potamilus streckersoni]|uniref:Sodium/nucleoside cotransporter n=1 Tax=Potamilus streckersoni TaxID=2493646 RepID=A0AAE0SAY9_9BIVA|nr:hypothetical protein CHS0354_012071 [Potamilus streckersoni]
MAELKGVKHFNEVSDTDAGDPSNYASVYTINDNSNFSPSNGYGEENCGFVPDEMELKHRKINGENRPIPEDSEEEETELTGFAVYMDIFQTGLHEFYKGWRTVIWTMIYSLLTLAYFAYFGYAMYYEFGEEGSIRLLIVTILATIFVMYQLIAKHCTIPVSSSCEGQKANKVGIWFHRSMIIALSLFIVIYVIVAIAIESPRNLISAAGILFYVLVFYIFSKHPSRVNWRPVFWGLALQFIFALMILRWDVGYRIFEWLGDRVQEFLAHTDKGSEFLFGKNTYEHHFFAFKVLPVIIFFSSMMSVLYYLGVMQLIIRNLARFMAWVMETSPAESLNAAGNIFIGQSEAPLMIRPFLNDMTNSELHAVLTGGFATIAGSVMAAYILMDVPANHLLSASVMSAPAALAMSKLFYPETKKSKSRAEDVYNMEKTGERNIIEAASNGASVSIKLVANIAVNLIAFIAILGFVNATLAWMGRRVGILNPELSFELICSYIFWPLSFLMGVDTDDCRKVAKLIGIKTFINEFVAYSVLGEYIHNTVNFTRYINNETGTLTTGRWSAINDDDILLHDLNATLVGGIITDRSKVITTYALCGFSNISSIGIMLGALGALAPNRKSDLTKIVVRAMIAGNVACFMTACIAGLLYEGKL